MAGMGVAVECVGSIVGVMRVKPFSKGELQMIGALPSGFVHGLRSIMPFTATAGAVATFVPTAILFLLFSLPLFIFCRDHNPAPKGTPVRWGAAFNEVAHTIRDSKKHPGALRFIITTVVYQDAIGTIITFMTVYAVKAIGFAAVSAVTLFVILTIPAIFGSYIAGRMVDRIGPKKTLQATLWIWVALLICLAIVPTQAAFWA